MPIRLYEDGTVIKYALSHGGAPKGGKANGNKTKHFEINGKHKRFIRSAAIRQFLTKKNRPLFATLTFPGKIDQGQANKCFSNFVDNLKTNYKLHSYVAVKENHKSGNPHFHIILDIPFIHFKYINRAWCASFSDFLPFSKNAFTTGRRNIIYSVTDVARYISKYITKVTEAQKEIKPDTRQYFVSMNVHSQSVIIDETALIYLLATNVFHEYEGDFFTWYKLKNFECLPEVWKSWAESIYRPPPKPPPKLTRQQISKNADLSMNYSFQFD